MASPREEGELLESSSSSGEEDYEEEQSSSGKPGQSAVKFKNDGSFLEMFKKMQESSQQSAKEPVPEKKDSTQLKIKNPDNSSTHADPCPTEVVPAQPAQKKPGLMSLVGKRRGGKSLPVGVVKKQKKPEEEESSGKTDAWSQYMNEVKKYKERLGDEEEKNRPLVK